MDIIPEISTHFRILPEILRNDNIYWTVHIFLHISGNVRIPKISSFSGNFRLFLEISTYFPEMSIYFGKFLEMSTYFRLFPEISGYFRLFPENIYFAYSEHVWPPWLKDIHSLITSLPRNGNKLKHYADWLWTFHDDPRQKNLWRKNKVYRWGNRPFNKAGSIQTSNIDPLIWF